MRSLICEWLAWILRMKRPGRTLTREFLLRKSKMRELEARNPPSMSLLANVKDVDNVIPINSEYRTQYTSTVNNHSTPTHASQFLNNFDDGLKSTVKGELLAILSELRFITHRMKEGNDSQDEINEWKFAAMVIDRLCFWIFTAYLVITTVAIFFNAPHIFGG